MASGRVGGTRSKISGQVGDVIYQVRRNEDGSYSQVVYGKPEKVSPTATPKTQAQQMCTAIVEAMMRDLREVGRISMQSGVNKSKSLNAFSSMNLQLVAQDCKAHWYEGNQFFYPTREMKGATNEALGGRFMLSAGTLQYDCFGSKVMWLPERNDWVVPNPLNYRYYGLSWPAPNVGETVGEYLRRRRMTRLDSVCYAAFVEWLDTWSIEGETIDNTKYIWLIASVNPDMPDDTILTQSTFTSLFLVDSNHSYMLRVSDATGELFMGFQIDVREKEEHLYFDGAFTISWADGKKKISTAYMLPTDGDTDGYLLGYAPADVFHSWFPQGDGARAPSPFG